MHIFCSGSMIQITLQKVRYINFLVQVKVMLFELELLLLDFFWGGECSRIFYPNWISQFVFWFNLLLSRFFGERDSHMRGDLLIRILFSDSITNSKHLTKGPFFSSLPPPLSRGETSNRKVTLKYFSFIICSPHIYKNFFS